MTEPYDQTALDLCNTCGWKTLVPTEGCLNCEREKDIAELRRLQAENETLRSDAERIDWLTGTLFVGRWNGVIDGGRKVTWTIPGDWRHTCATMVGDDLRTAIDAAMRAQEAVTNGTT